MKVLITGGAGFVGSNIAIALKQHFPDAEVSALDNLHRSGSEINPPRLKKHGIDFIKGDVRNPADLATAGQIDWLIECSAEPSVLAGKDGDTDFLIQTNLQGAINCADLCRQQQAGMIFLSTSRVYPMAPLVNCGFRETDTRFELSKEQPVPGFSARGVAESFPMHGARSLYGATKYAAEIMLEEYRDAFSLPILINRCGVIAGPWQFGKADQGIAAFWLAAHYFAKPLRYIGFGGSGKQVRDMLHIDDLINLLLAQLAEPAKFSNGVFNVGGGREVSASLLELTGICQEITGKNVPVTPELATRYADIPVYLTDNSKIRGTTNWKAEKSVPEIITDIFRWLNETPEVHPFFK